jgi:hypothetical protein
MQMCWKTKTKNRYAVDCPIIRIPCAVAYVTYCRYVLYDTPGFRAGTLAGAGASFRAAR